MRRGVFIYFFILFFVLSLIGGSVFTTYNQFVAEGPLTERKEVVIPKGKGLKQVAALLHEEGVIASPSIFVLGTRASGNAEKLKAGEYSFPRGASAKMVMNILIGGNTVVRRLVVPEGLTSAQIVALMDGMRGLEGEVKHIPRNGTLLPDTYHYTYGDTKESMIRRMQNAMRRALEELWPTRAEGLPFRDVKEAVVMASIVEKETSLDRERAHIASVFINRLEQNIRLQSDPTVIYAVTNGRLDLNRSLTYADLRYQHPYNTYVIYGLPDGPISNPGYKSLQAVLHPMETKDIYFVADGTGGHVFAETYKEHQWNVKNWRRIRKGLKPLSRSVAQQKQPVAVKSASQKQSEPLVSTISSTTSKQDKSSKKTGDSSSKIPDIPKEKPVFSSP